MRKKLFLFCFAITATFWAQTIERQVVSTSGGSISNGGVTLDFTVGELVVSEITNGANTLSQGFQQGDILLSLTIDPNVFLLGASLNPTIGEENLMRDTLRNENNIPTTSPYDTTTCDASVFAVTGADAIVDWVEVELRDATDRSIKIASQSALLQRDGDVVATDGTSSLNFELANGDYYILVNHRNHLAILSAATYALSKTVTTVDLSTDSVSVFGENNAVTQLANGKYAMYAGDIDGNGQTQNTDISILSTALGNSGYSDSDADMNGQVQNSDVGNIVVPCVGKAVQF